MVDPQPEARPRRANIGDAMILMVAFAIGLVMAFRPWADIREWFAMISPISRPLSVAWWTDFARKNGPRFLVIQGCVQLMFSFLSPFTPALILARLRRPRPSLRAVFFQPGMSASLALCLIPLIVVELSFFDVVSISPLVAGVLPGAGVLAAWSLLVATGRWHPEASWVDRGGRLLGAFWLATIPWAIWVTSR